MGGASACPPRAARALKAELSTVKRLIALLLKADDAPAALAECRAWAGSFPQDAHAYRTMAEIYRKLGDQVSELRALTMLVEVAPREAAQCRAVAVTFAERKDYRRAVVQGFVQAALEEAIAECRARHCDRTQEAIHA